MEGRTIFNFHLILKQSVLWIGQKAEVLVNSFTCFSFKKSKLEMYIYPAYSLVGRIIVYGYVGINNNILNMALCVST